jgi:tRNA(adenine34) deaminase
MIHKININKDLNYIFDILYQQSIKAQKKKEVPISALIFDPKNNRIISKSHNQNVKDNNPCSHAEIISIIKACKKLNKNRLDGMDLYCSLEPCLMCSSVIYQSKIRRVYFATDDKKNGALINNYKLGLKKNLNHRIDIYYGFQEEKFSNLLKKFFKKKR